MARTWSATTCSAITTPPSPEAETRPRRSGGSDQTRVRDGNAVAELGQRAGLGLDKIPAYSRHRTIATLMLYAHEHDRQRTQTTLVDLVASTLTSSSV
jgi:hypothetical protein